MIFDRRVYTLRPGKLEAYWDAQRAWNVRERSAAMLDHNLGFFGSLAGVDQQVVHLYRFSSLEHWRDSLAQFMRTQSSDYFKLVRPWIVEQDSTLLMLPPIDELIEAWSSDVPLPPAGFESLTADALSRLVVSEQVTDFLLGGLTLYWDAYREWVTTSELASRHRMGVLVSMVGRLHRVFTYRCFRTMDDFRTHQDALRADAHWHAFVDAHCDVVGASRTTLLQPSPVPEQCSLFRHSG